MNFSELVTSSVLTRALALFVLLSAWLMAATIAVYDVFTHQAIPMDIVSIVTLGLGYALTILGLNYGVRLQDPNHPVASPENTTTTGETDVKQP